MKPRLLIVQGAGAGQDPLDPVAPALPHLEAAADVRLMRGATLRALMREVRPGRDLVLLDMTEAPEATRMRAAPSRLYCAILRGGSHVDLTAGAEVISLDARLPGAQWLARRGASDTDATGAGFVFAAHGSSDFIYAAMLGWRDARTGGRMLALVSDEAEAARTQILGGRLGLSGAVEVRVAATRAALARGVFDAEVIADGASGVLFAAGGMSDACFAARMVGAAERAFPGPLADAPAEIVRFLAEAPPRDASRAAAFREVRSGASLARIILAAAEAARARALATQPASAQRTESAT